MYNHLDIANRIKKIAKEQNKSLGEVLSACGLGVNTVSKISKGTDILTLNFARIADYLDCSVDYLLGRTDNPKSHLAPTDTSVVDVDYKEYTERIEQTAADFWAERIAALKAKRQQDRDKKIQEYLENRSAELLQKLADAKLSDGLEIFDGAEVVESTVQHKGRKAIKQ